MQNSNEQILVWPRAVRKKICFLKIRKWWQKMAAKWPKRPKRQKDMQWVNTTEDCTIQEHACSKVCHARIARWFCPHDVANGMGVGGGGHSQSVLSNYFPCSTLSRSCGLLAYLFYQSADKYWVPNNCHTLFLAGRIQGWIKQGIQRRRWCNQVSEKLPHTVQTPKSLFVI